MRESISYSKLRDGSWGVRVATQGRGYSPGDTVVVTKRDGNSNEVVLGAIVEQDKGAFPGPATIYRLAKRNGGSKNGGLRVARDGRGLGYGSALARESLIYEGKQLAKLVAVLEAQEQDGADVEEALAIARASLTLLRQQYATRYLGRTA